MWVWAKYSRINCALIFVYLIIWWQRNQIKQKFLALNFHFLITLGIHKNHYITYSSANHHLLLEKFKKILKFAKSPRTFRKFEQAWHNTRKSPKILENFFCEMFCFVIYFQKSRKKPCRNLHKFEFCKNNKYVKRSVQYSKIKIFDLIFLKTKQ